MIGTFLNLIDKVLQLLRLRDSRKDKRFNKIWQPVFEDLRKIHTDYLEILETCSNALNEIASSPEGEETRRQVKDVISILRKARLKFEPVRRQLLAIINETQKFGFDDTEEKYLSSLTHYFPSMSNRKLSTAASETLTLLEALNEVLTSNEYEPRFVSDSIHNTNLEISGALAKMRRSWDKVCASYSVLQHENSRLDV